MQIFRQALLAASMVALLSQATRPIGDKLQTKAVTCTIGQVEVDLAVWRIGELYIAAAPVELFGELLMELRRRVDGPLLMVTNANGWEGYWPTKEAFAEGGYEVDGAKRRLRPGDGEKLVDALTELASQLSD